MAGTFDDIIRKVLGMDAPPSSMPTPYQLDETEPFHGSELGPMIEDWLAEPNRHPIVNEGDMIPMTDQELQRDRTVGGPKLLPYDATVEPFKPDFLPEQEDDIPDRRPNAPRRRGNSKTGTGLDV